MKRSVRLDPEAERELKAATAYYAKRSKAVAQRFMARVLELSDVLSVSADRFPRLQEPRVDEPIRRALVPGFPYALVFIETRNRVHVLAIAHTRREPGFWLARLDEVDETD